MGGAQLLLSEEWHPRVGGVNITPLWQFWGLAAGTGSSQARSGSLCYVRRLGQSKQVLLCRGWSGHSQDKGVPEEVGDCKLILQRQHPLALRALKA